MITNRLASIGNITDALNNFSPVSGDPGILPPVKLPVIGVEGLTTVKVTELEFAV